MRELTARLWRAGNMALPEILVEVRTVALGPAARASGWAALL